MLSSKQSSVPFIHLSIPIHPSLYMPVLQDPDLERLVVITPAITLVVRKLGFV